MDGMVFVILFAVSAILAIMLWGLSFSIDHSRIQDYVGKRGGRVVSITWAPFGKGWFGEKNDRIYEVVYYDSDGRQHWATCKTSLFSGVYWTEDRVTHDRPGWYDRLPASNEPGAPFIQHVGEKEAAKQADAEVFGLSSEADSLQSVDAEIDELKKRLAELEDKKQRLTSYRPSEPE